MDIAVIQSIKEEINPHLPEDYEIKCLIAEGRMGTIYTAVSHSSGHFIAIKTVLTKNDENMRVRMMEECNLQRKLRHVNIGSVFGCKETGLYTIICMELLTGGDLFDSIPVGRGINMNKGYRIYTELLSALEFCHCHCIVHMDVKPENVMMSHSGRSKLIDFGLAVDHSRIPFIEGYLGTTAYSAPETFTLSKYKGYKADLFSLNVTFLTVITGERCWSKAVIDDYHYLDWLDRRWTLDVFKRIPTDLFNFLVLALAHDPLKRLSIEQIKAQNWFQNGAAQKIKSVKSPSKIITNEDSAKSQPMLTKFEIEVDSYDIQLSQPADLGSILMPEIKDGEQIVKRMSRFFSKRSIVETLQLLSIVIEQQNNCTIINNSTNCITVQSSHLSGFDVVFRIFVYLFGGAILVDFRRIKGDGLLFRNTFVNIKDTVMQIGWVHEYDDCLKKIQPQC